jgi:hypothetical protein
MANLYKLDARGNGIRLPEEAKTFYSSNVHTGLLHSNSDYLKIEILGPGKGDEKQASLPECEAVWTDKRVPQHSKNTRNFLPFMESCSLSFFLHSQQTKPTLYHS